VKRKVEKATGGELRMCTFDVAAQEHYGFDVVALDDGVLSVWVRESVDASSVEGDSNTSDEH
jgi:hypothetical protein